MIRLDQVIKNFEECIQALLDKLESRIPGTILGLLWWCFVLFRALLGFTWVFVLRHTVLEDLVLEKSGDDRTEPRIVDVGIVQGKQKEVAVQEGRNMDGEVADQCNVVALEAIPVQTNDAGPSTSISSPVLPDFEKLLRFIPNSDGLKQLLDVSVNWAGLCTKKHGGEVPSADGDDQKVEFSVKAQEMYEILRVATNLKGGAGVLAAMAPDLLDMAHTFAAVIPSVLEVATGFEKFVSPIMSLLEERVKQME